MMTIKTQFLHWINGVFAEDLRKAFMGWIWDMDSGEGNLLLNVWDGKDSTIYRANLIKSTSEMFGSEVHEQLAHIWNGFEEV